MSAEPVTNTSSVFFLFSTFVNDRVANCGLIWRITCFKKPQNSCLNIFQNIVISVQLPGLEKKKNTTIPTILGTSGHCGGVAK